MSLPATDSWQRRLGDWHVSVRRGALLNDDALLAALGSRHSSLVGAPEMAFDADVRLQRTIGDSDESIALAFSTAQALRQLPTTAPSGLQVAAAGRWAASRCARAASKANKHERAKEGRKE